MRRARVVLVAAVLGAVLAGAGAARADEAEGKRRFKAGQELYQQKRFLEAAREFEAGYAEAPRPLFLMNIGHAYRRANELVKAKSAYEALLRLQPDLPQRGEVEEYIKTINDVLQANEPSVPDRAPPPPPAPSRTVPPTPSRSLPPPVMAAPDPIVPAYVEARERPPEEPSVSVFRKPWFWVVTGAIVAGGVAVAVIASRPSSPCPGTLCIRE